MPFGSTDPSNSADRSDFIVRRPTHPGRLFAGEGHFQRMLQQHLLPGSHQHPLLGRNILLTRAGTHVVHERLSAAGRPDAGGNVADTFGLAAGHHHGTSQRAVIAAVRIGSRFIERVVRLSGKQFGSCMDHDPRSNGERIRTPQPRPKIRMGSRMMLMTAPMTVVSILIFAKPWVVMKGFMPMTSSTNTEPRM